MGSRKLFLGLIFVFSFSTPFFAMSQESSTPSDGASESSSMSYSWGLGLGYGLYSGVTAQSFSGLSLSQGRVSYGRSTGFIRPQFALRIQVSSGELLFLESQTDVQLITLGAGAGFQVYPLSEGRVAPFIGVEGYGERGSLRFTNPPLGYGIFNRPNTYGYEITLGFDLQKSSHTVFRLGVAYGYEFLKVGQSAAIKNPSFKVFLSF